MTIGELKKAIKDLPDDLQVRVEGNGFDLDVRSSVYQVADGMTYLMLKEA